MRFCSLDQGKIVGSVARTLLLALGLVLCIGVAVGHPLDVLLIQPSPRISGMGGAGCAVEDGVYGTYCNPANFPGSNSREVALSFSRSWTYHSAGYCQSFDRFYISAAFTHLARLFGGPGPSFSPSLALGYLAFNNLGAGVVLKYVSTSPIAGEYADFSWTRVPVSVPALDIGLLSKESIGGLSLGVSLSNLGPDFPWDPYGRAPLPRTLRSGLGYAFSVGRDEVVVSADIVLDLVRPGDWLEHFWNRTDHCVGAEYSFRNLVALRCGYYYKWSSPTTNRSMPTFGGAVKCRGLRFDMAFDPGFLSGFFEDDRLVFSISKRW